jgi:signal transduction histidine kinase
MTAGRMRFAGGLAVLAAAAAAANWYAPTVFFDSQLMLGGSLAVLAVLHYGPAGLLVGLAALAVTVIRWQHPYELLIGSGFLFWLTVFLQRFNGGWEHRGNGRLLLAALGFWLLAGFWLETGIFMRAFGLPFREALGIGIKETFTGLANTTLGFLAFVSIAWWQARGGLETVSIRGLVCGLVLAAIAIPGIAITFVLSAQLKENLLDDQLKALRYAGERTAHAFEHGEPLPTAPGGLSPAVAVLVRRRDGSQTSTDPALFARLDQDYEREAPSRTGLPDLDILVPSRGGPRIQVDQESYWVTRFAHGKLPEPGAAAGTVVVAQPVTDLISRLDSTLLPRTFGLLLGLLVSGIAAAELIGAAAERQYALALAPLRQPGDATTMPPLPAVKIRELDELVAAINDRSRRVTELTASLEAALEAERNTRDELAEARLRERQADRRMQEILRQKLQTSLTAAAVAHEINQPLSRILLRAQLNRERRTEAAERETLDALIADAERVVVTIQKMNVLLRNVETDHRPIDLGQIVTSGLLQLKGLLRRTEVSVTKAVPPTGCEVSGDDVQLQMMVTNLVRNAAEAIEAGNSDRREIAIELQADADRVELVIGDSGPGWPGGTIDDKLLDSSKPQGTGIGLFVVKTAVENHQGELAVGRSPLGGAEFRVRLLCRGRGHHRAKRTTPG